MINAAMAQSVERVLGKDEVGGSNPPSSSIMQPIPCGLVAFFPIFNTHTYDGRENYGIQKDLDNSGHFLCWAMLADGSVADFVRLRTRNVYFAVRRFIDSYSRI